MNYLAIDLGAESGRVVLGSIDSGQIRLEEVHRFPNIPLRKESSLEWNLPDLLVGVMTGLAKAAERKIPVAAISADSLGVDCVLNIEQVFHYRDPRTARSSREFLQKIPWETIFAETGIQYMPLNTLFQLAAEPRERLQSARRILSIADYVNAFLGRGSAGACIEESMASTFQLYNPRTRDWSPLLLEALGLPRSALGDVVRPGTIVGATSPLNAWFPGQEIKIIATCSHDTGAAVAAVPADANTNWAYLSSGTWSLMGVERPPANDGSLDPVITDLARQLNFTNEIGFGSTIRLLKNISGLWLLQECRRVWAAGGKNFDYAELTRLAEAETPFRSLINPMHDRFLAPPSMPHEIAAACRETSQPVPASPAQFTRCILESLALLYRQTLLQLEKLTGRKIEALHIVGGGSKNALLDQFTASSCQIPVLAGPVEATALGNIFIQSIALGETSGLTDARRLIGENFDLARYEPAGDWSHAEQRFHQIQTSK